MAEMSERTGVWIVGACGDVAVSAMVGARVKDPIGGAEHDLAIQFQALLEYAGAR